jgi:hypothetical protein
MGMHDSQVLLDIAPPYFRYMESTASRPSVLAKLLGFYTVEIKNLEAGTTQAKADLLVMENLFYNQNVTKTFDLKGIQGRKVKSTREVAASSTNSTGDNKEAGSKQSHTVKKKKTLFDGDWIEGNHIVFPQVFDVVQFTQPQNLRPTKSPRLSAASLQSCTQRSSQSGRRFPL